MKDDYVPGQLIKEFTKSIQPPSEYDAEFEYGFYDGDYSVKENASDRLRPELEKIRLAALTRWRDRLIAFPEIIKWVNAGAPDPLTDEETMQVGRQGTE